VIFGTGGIAEIVHFYLEHDSPHEVVAFTAHGDQLDQKEYRGLPVVPFEEVEQRYSPADHAMYVAIGYRGVNQIRAEVFGQAKEKGYELITYISSKATFWDANEIGENCFIFEDNTIQPYVKVGDNVIMWSGNHIGHSAEIGDHCFISSHVVVSGYTRIGAYSFLGVNSTFRDDITIGESNVIGAGAIIMKDTKDHEVYVPERTKAFPKRSDEIDF
jgi:sugar O-acyltransferase (sialic acid O-acetyltransferase NeuD family)